MSRKKSAAGDPLKQALARGIALHRRGQLREAEQQFLSVLRTRPDHAPTHHALGFLYFQAGRLDLSRQALERCVALKGRNAPAWYDLGNTLRDLGQLPGAAAAYQKAIKLDPDFARAHCALAQLRDHREPDEFAAEYRALSQAYARSRSNSPERRDLAWGMARAAEQRGEGERCLALLREAHRIQRGERRFSIEATQRYFGAIREIFNREFIDACADIGDHSEVPVFVFGLPRSGTSLVEQILASHSEVHGAGELRLLGNLCGEMERQSGQVYAAAFARLDAAAKRRVARDLETRLRQLAPRARRVVDKMPSNYLCIGMLAVLLPRARFIHCRRDALATCWSIYSTRFSEPHTFADELGDLGAYYREYEGLMAHWDEVLPGRIHHLDYEQLVAEPESQIPALLAAVGLDCEPACLEPHRTERAVRTASAVQVREPIHSGAISRAEALGDLLDPLRQALLQPPLGKVA
ncbi:tetratricopeptide repeat-containing sulfotransferase family protein [Parahaliea aestuarii]|uniref:Tetratricopeptide repeat protein n=1 Tax=Parahaliea aestuarii TaxID=1852021 RepID=A0A5C8ZXP3_9GAMM|nr:sulfotransferase [Parahaliea aestuarii]TXS92237.1 tetratricopeptide repeat protein [Parahaliea aestuarii]